MFRIVTEGTEYREHVLLKDGQGIHLRPGTPEDLPPVSAFLHTVSLDRPRRPVPGPVVRHDHLESLRGKVLAGQAPQALDEDVAPVVGRDHDRDDRLGGGGRAGGAGGPEHRGRGAEHVHGKPRPGHGRRSAAARPTTSPRSPPGAPPPPAGGGSRDKPSGSLVSGGSHFSTACASASRRGFPRHGSPRRPPCGKARTRPAAFWSPPPSSRPRRRSSRAAGSRGIPPCARSGRDASCTR